MDVDTGQHHSPSPTRFCPSSDPTEWELPPPPSAQGDANMVRSSELLILCDSLKANWKQQNNDLDHNKGFSHHREPLSSPPGWQPSVPCSSSTDPDLPMFPSDSDLPPTFPAVSQAEMALFLSQAQISEPPPTLPLLQSLDSPAPAPTQPFVHPFKLKRSTCVRQAILEAGTGDLSPGYGSASRTFTPPAKLKVPERYRQRRMEERAREAQAAATSSSDGTSVSTLTSGVTAEPQTVNYELQRLDIDLDELSSTIAVLRLKYDRLFALRSSLAQKGKN